MTALIRPDLMGKRIIYMLNKIDDETSEDICAAIVTLNQSESSPIRLYIDTKGGTSGEHLFDAIQMSQAPVHGIVVGKAHSAGFVALEACHRRIAFPNATLLHHAGAISIAIDKPEFDQEVAQMRSFTEKVRKLIVSRGNISLETIEKWEKEERRIQASEALQYGLIDAIATEL